MATGTTAQQIVDVVTPAAGESVTEGTILEWHVKVGDRVAGDTVTVGQVIARIAVGEANGATPTDGNAPPADDTKAESETDSAPQAVANGAGNGATATAAAPTGEQPASGK